MFSICRVINVWEVFFVYIEFRFYKVILKDKIIYCDIFKYLIYIILFVIESILIDRNMF